MAKKIRSIFYVVGIILIIRGTVYAFVPLQEGDGGVITRTYASI